MWLENLIVKIEKKNINQGLTYSFISGDFCIQDAFSQTTRVFFFFYLVWNT